MRSHDMNDDDLIRRYLLGGLEEEQAETLERRLLEEDDLFELAEAVEGDLFAAAARGELTPAERGRILRRAAATPEGRARLALAQGLTSLGREQVRVPAVLAFRKPATVGPVARAAALAAGLAAVAGGLWLASPTAHHPGRGVQVIARESGRPVIETPGAQRPHRDQQVAQAPSPRPIVPAAPVPREPVPPAVTPEEPRVAEQRPELRSLVLQLALTSVRGSATVPRLEVPPGTGTVEIRLPLDAAEPATSFSAVLRNAVTGEEIRREETLAAQSVDGEKVVVLSVRAVQMAPGTYEVEVRGDIPEEGIELLGRPMFEVSAP